VSTGAIIGTVLGIIGFLFQVAIVVYQAGKMNKSVEAVKKRQDKHSDQWNGFITKTFQDFKTEVRVSMKGVSTSMKSVEDKVDVLSGKVGEIERHRHEEQQDELRRLREMKASHVSIPGT
jgi:hypothetical protein